MENTTSNTIKEQIVEKLTAAGGKLWQKNGSSRIYFDYNLVLERAGFSANRYGSGNISSATLKGESISNSEAKRIVNAVYSRKFWYDLDDGKFYTKDFMKPDPYYQPMTDNFFSHLRDMIK